MVTTATINTISYVRASSWCFHHHAWQWEKRLLMQLGSSDQRSEVCERALSGCLCVCVRVCDGMWQLWSLLVRPPLSEVIWLWNHRDRHQITNPPPVCCPQLNTHTHTHMRTQRHPEPLTVGYLGPGCPVFVVVYSSADSRKWTVMWRSVCCLIGCWLFLFSVHCGDAWFHASLWGRSRMQGHKPKYGEKTSVFLLKLE